MPFEVAEKIYPIYDSWELVSPIDEDLLFKVTKDKSEIVDEVDAHAKELLKSIPAKSITKGIVADYCLRNDLPRTWVDLVYNSVKASQFKSGTNI